MLATLVIGLREGLEASLIVGIIAAFLVRAGKPLRAMWIGVGAAVALSIGVGVLLQVISADLPQAQQEGMESIIGFVAVVFVTGMIGWMNRHARNMRKDLEQHAASALRDGTAWALVGMAFLAVLKEGFETSVFLLAAFQSSTSSLAAGAGAIIGIGISVAIGVGIYRGGIKLNLAKFFRITGLFLVLVAAGLVLSALRTAHEAGWILVGQQRTLDLSWLAPNGSIQAALLTGVLGIPADPRLIEVLGWAAYLVPVLLYLLWPAAHRPTPAQKPRLLVTLAAASGVVAIVLALAVQLPDRFEAVPAKTVTASGSSAGSASLVSDGDSYRLTHGGAVVSFTTRDTTADLHADVAARLLERTTTTPAETTTMTLTDLIALSGGRVPIGINASDYPGPYAASTRATTALSVWTTGSTLLDASQRTTELVTLSGGGLTSPLTLTISPTTATSSWAVVSGYPTAVVAALAAASASRSELLLWKLYLPLALALAAIVLCALALRARRVERKSSAREPMTITRAAQPARV